MIEKKAFQKSKQLTARETSKRLEKDFKFDFVNMDLQQMIQSSEASGYKEFMRDILKTLNLEELKKMRLVSKTFNNFLLNERKIWIAEINKTFLNTLKIIGHVQFKDFLESGFGTTEEMITNYEKKWIEVFIKIQKIATIKQLIKICNLLTPENYVNLYREINYLMSGFSAVTPMMWVYFHTIIGSI